MGIANTISLRELLFTRVKIIIVVLSTAKMIDFLMRSSIFLMSPLMFSRDSLFYYTFLTHFMRSPHVNCHFIPLKSVP